MPDIKIFCLQVVIENRDFFYQTLFISNVMLSSVHAFKCHTSRQLFRFCFEEKLSICQLTLSDKLVDKSRAKFTRTSNTAWVLFF